MVKLIATLTLSICIILQCSQLSICYGSKILGLFPHAGKSHYDFFKPLMIGLSNAGHDVTVLSRFSNGKNSIQNYQEFLLKGMKPMVDIIDLKNFENPSIFSTKISSFFIIHNWGIEACKNTLQSKEIKNLLDAKVHYDVILVEQFNSDCMLPIAHLLNAPVIGLSSSAILPWHYKRMGSPFLPSYMPSVFHGHSDRMNLFQRVKNFAYYYLINFLYDHLTQKETNKLIRTYLGTNIPKVEDLANNISVMLINQHYSLTGVKPFSPAIVEISGLQIEEPVQIDKDLKKILDSSKDGIIYINWGSMVRAETLPDKKQDAILSAVSRLNATILWKWESDTLINRPKNVHIRKWMPQREILCHPNVKVFMTHGGMLGSSEAAYCGVLMVVTPLFGDQFVNAEAIKANQMGVILSYSEINQKNVYNALIDVLDQKKQLSAKQVSFAYRNRPQSPLNLSIWWVEHVIKSKGSPMTKSVYSELPWYSYLYFEVYLFFYACLILIYFFVKILIHVLKSFLKQKIKTN